MIPLWNIQRTAVSSREYRMPCIDEVFYEHIFDLPDERMVDDGYLIETKADILSLRYEENKVVLKTKQDSLKDVWGDEVNSDYSIETSNPDRITSESGESIWNNTNRINELRNKWEEQNNIKYEESEE